MNMKINKRWFYFTPALFYCGLIFFLSGRNLKLKLGILLWDKGAHWLEFMVLGFLLALGFFYNLPGKPYLRAYLTAMTGFFIGAVDELRQSLFPGRQCDWKDWLADIIGVTVGLALFWLLYLKKGQNSPGDRSQVC